jgi:hypothetical protein
VPVSLFQDDVTSTAEKENIIYKVSAFAASAARRLVEFCAASQASEAKKLFHGTFPSILSLLSLFYYYCSSPPEPIKQKTKGESRELLVNVSFINGSEYCPHFLPATYQF